MKPMVGAAPARRRPARGRKTAARTNLRAVPLTSRQIQLVRNSFRRVEPHAAIASLVLYRNLFRLDPGLRPRFQSSIELQGRKLMEALSCTVASLDNPKDLVPALEAIGRRHVTYGTRNEDYATLNAALLEALAETLGSAFTLEMRAAWAAALEFVAETMKRGAAPLQKLKESVN